MDLFVNIILSISVSVLVFGFIKRQIYQNVYRVLMTICIFIILSLLLLSLLFVFPVLQEGEGGAWWFFIMGIPFFIITFGLSLITVIVLKIIYDKFTPSKDKESCRHFVVSLSLFLGAFLFLEFTLYLSDNTLVTSEIFREDTFPMVVLPWVVVAWLSSKASSFIMSKFEIRESQVTRILFVPSPRDTPTVHQ